MRPLFANQEHQKQFEESGFVKLPLLSSEEVEQLKKVYLEQEFDNKIEGGFHVSLDNMNNELVEEVGERIKAVMEPKVEGVFDQGKVFTASYVIKEPGLKNIVPPHQDWSFVDESEFCSVTVWTPLVDVTEKNGALGIIPGSHKLFNHHRSSPSPQSKSPLADHIFSLFPYVEIVEMKAGETLIFNNKLIHASPPNLTDSPRIAVGIGVTQQEAQLKHYYHVPNSSPATLQVYDVNESFFPWYNNVRLSEFYDNGVCPPELNPAQSIDRIVPELTREEMQDLIETIEGAQINHGLMGRLAELFGYDVVSGVQKNECVEVEEEMNPEEIAEEKLPFYKVYTPGNIYREIIWRLKGRK